MHWGIEPALAITRSSRWKAAALIGLLHLGLSLVLLLYVFDRGMTRFDDASPPDARVRLAEGALRVVTSPARFIWNQLSPGPLQRAVEWPLVIANSALWGYVGSAVYALWLRKRAQ